MKLCLNTHNLAGKMSVDEIISVCKKTGVSGVEFSVGYGHAHGVEFETSTEELTKIRDRILDNGLQVVSIATYCRFDSESEEERAQNMDAAKKGIKIAGAMRAEIFRFVGNDLPNHTPRDAFLKRMASTMSELADYATPYNINALLQIHGTLSRASDVAEIARLCEKPNSGLVLNCDDSEIVNGRVDNYLNGVSKYAKHIHMHCMLNNYPYRKFFSIMKKENYNGWYSIVVDDASAEVEKFLGYYVRLAESLYYGV